MKAIEFIGGCTGTTIYLQARLAKKSFLFDHLFFNITNVFCAKKRVGHACICPRMDTGPASFEVIPPKSWLFRGQKIGNSPVKAAISVWILLKKFRPIFVLFSFGCFLRNSVTSISALTNNKRSCSKKWIISSQNCGFLFFRQQFCHAVLDFCEQQASLPDLFDHARSITIG